LITGDAEELHNALTFIAGTEAAAALDKLSRKQVSTAAGRR